MTSSAIIFRLRKHADYQRVYKAGRKQFADDANAVACGELEVIRSQIFRATHMNVDESRRGLHDYMRAKRTGLPILHDARNRSHEIALASLAIAGTQ